MSLKKIAAILIIPFAISCKKQAPKHVWTYDGWKGEVEMLNGPVKEIYQGDSTKAWAYFKRIDFDENGDMVRREERELAWSETKGEKDSDLFITNTKYSTVVDKRGKKIAFVGDYQIIDMNKHTKDTSSGKSKWDLDEKGNLVICHPNANSSAAGGQYYYDKNGNMIRYTTTTDNHCCGETATFKYDHFHRIVETNWGEDEGSGADGTRVILKTTSRFLKTDGEGNWVISADYDLNLLNRQCPPRTDTVTRKITYYK